MAVYTITTFTIHLTLSVSGPGWKKILQTSLPATLALWIPSLFLDYPAHQFRFNFLLTFLDFGYVQQTKLAIIRLLRKHRIFTFTY